MATNILPNVRTVISGSGVTAFDQKVEFTLSEKLETTLLIKSTNSASIAYANIDNIKSILFYSTSNFTVNLTVDIGTTEVPNVVIFPIATTGNFRFDPTVVFMSKISAISISTESTTDISVDVCIYGEST